MNDDRSLLGSDPVEIGHALFSFHDPHVGHEKAFNRYYERDHMYSAALLAPFTIAGQRWVATRDLKQLRQSHTEAQQPGPFGQQQPGPFGQQQPGPFGPIASGSYLTMFWIQANRLANQQAWVSTQMASLVEAGRTFAERDVQTATAYDYLGSYRRNPDGVPPFMALDHRYQGFVWFIVERIGDAPLADFAQWLCDSFFSTHLGRSPVALACAFTPRPKEPWWPAAAPEVEGVGDRAFVAMFVEADPRDAWTDVFAPLPAALDATGAARTLLLAPFIPTRPGTDAYTDELW